MMRCMHRTNIYLTEEQEQALDERARRADTTRSAIVREIIDRDLAATTAIDPSVAAGFRELADVYGEITDGLFDDDADLRIDR